MERRCSRCGGRARYLVGLQVDVLDLETVRDRKKMISVALCEECEGLSREFLRRDAGQRRRVADALCQEVKRGFPLQSREHGRAAASSPHPASPSPGRPGASSLGEGKSRGRLGGE